MRRAVACLAAAVVLAACNDGAERSDAPGRPAQVSSLYITSMVITALPAGVDVLGQRAAL